MKLIDIDQANIEDIKQTSLEPFLDGTWCETKDVQDWLNEQPVLEATIPFPWQHINAYCRGEITFDAACDNTIEEFYRLAEEYIEEHKEKEI